MSDLTPGWVFSDAERAGMRAALEEARAAVDRGDVPVGAALLDPAGTIVARAHNRREADQDPTSHAEILTLRAASRALGSWRLEGCTLLVTLEPCAMCAAAAVHARLACVVWGAADPKGGFAGSLVNLLDDPRLNHRVAVRGGLMAGEAASLLETFFAKLRDRG